MGSSTSDASLAQDALLEEAAKALAAEAAQLRAGGWWLPQAALSRRAAERVEALGREATGALGAISETAQLSAQASWDESALPEVLQKEHQNALAAAESKSREMAAELAAQVDNFNAYRSRAHR